ncbi:glycosyltransferase [Microbacterium indicum]|uniref:glycosyltransferase n=1 Tax=Microbacterium indicum TaxID=358100 RepID=UPI0004141CDA|nr:glycosyltransferase [Microbacterium indicum]
MRPGPHVLVFPSYNDNPFLNLLQLAAAADGYRIVRANTYDDLVSHARELERGDVLHLHWTTPILQQAPTESAARQRLSAMRDGLARLRGRGVGVVWTVHNRLPHELTFRDLEVRLMQTIAAAADAIHVMAPHTRAALADVVDLPEDRIRVLPHPSYEGIYDTRAPRDASRAAFGLGDGERAVLFLGQIRPYKGVDALVTAAASAAERADIALLLAGQVKGMSADDFAASIPDEVHAVTQLSFVDDGDMAGWFGAADVAVFPYRAILNSGSVHLAATFRVPVVLPGDPFLREQFSAEPWVAFFDPADPAASIADLLADPDLFAGVDDASFDAFLAGIAPWDVSRSYSALLSDVSRSAGAR